MIEGPSGLLMKYCSAARKSGSVNAARRAASSRRSWSARESGSPSTGRVEISITASRSPSEKVYSPGEERVARVAVGGERGGARPRLKPGLDAVEHHAAAAAIVADQPRVVAPRADAVGGAHGVAAEAVGLEPLVARFDHRSRSAATCAAP